MAISFGGPFFVGLSGRLFVNGFPIFSASFGLLCSSFIARTARSGSQSCACFVLNISGRFVGALVPFSSCDDWYLASCVGRRVILRCG